MAFRKLTKQEIGQRLLEKLGAVSWNDVLFHQSIDLKELEAALNEFKLGDETINRIKKQRRFSIFYGSGSGAQFAMAFDYMQITKTEYDLDIKFSVGLPDIQDELHLTTDQKFKVDLQPWEGNQLPALVQKKILEQERKGKSEYDSVLSITAVDSGLVIYCPWTEKEYLAEQLAIKNPLDKWKQARQKKLMGLNEEEIIKQMERIKQIDELIGNDPFLQIQDSWLKHQPMTPPYFTGYQVRVPEKK